MRSGFPNWTVYARSRAALLLKQCTPEVQPPCCWSSVRQKYSRPVAGTVYARSIPAFGWSSVRQKYSHPVAGIVYARSTAALSLEQCTSEVQPPVPWTRHPVNQHSSRTNRSSSWGLTNSAPFWAVLLIRIQIKIYLGVWYLFLKACRNWTRILSTAKPDLYRKI